MTIRENWRETRGARGIREGKSREIFPSITNHLVMIPCYLMAMTIRKNSKETHGTREIREGKSREIFPSITNHLAMIPYHC